MKKMLLGLILIVMSLGFTGCTSVSNKKILDANLVKEKVVKGTDKKDIENEFGIPSKIKYENNGNETWLYSSKEIFNPTNLLGVYNLEVTELNILFGKNEKVIKSAVTKREGTF